MQRLTHCTFRVGIALLGALLLWVGAGGLAYADHFPAEMVSATKHNLADNPNILFGKNSTLKGGSEVCVFCHTPHGSGFSSLLDTGIPPIWNRKINTNTTYTTYDSAKSPHFDSGTTLNGQIKGVSLACLSCHDGTIAFDAMINIQGSGGYVPANATQGVGPGDDTLAQSLFLPFGGETAGPDNGVDGLHTFREGTRGNSAGEGPFAGSVYTNDTLDATNGTEPFPNLGLDLTNDHPISFQIPCTTNASGCDPQFSELVLGAVAEANNKMLYLKRDQSALGAGYGVGVYPQDKRDRIRAYPSIGGFVSSGSNTNAYIECASCHNPHTPRTLFLRLPSNVSQAGAFSSLPAGNGLASGGGLGGAAANATAAGVQNGTYWSHAPNQASAICLTCHQK